MADSTPLVSVAMITYNHERFISEAIDSVLAQQTNFPIELVIGEDASSDGTRRRIDKLKGRAPDIIRLLPHQTNMGMHRNLVAVLQECRGNFIAFLEGDDFWTSLDKLRLQVEALQSNPSFVGTFHPAIFVDEYSKQTGEIWPVKDLTYIGTQELLEGNPIPTASAMIRRHGLVTLTPKYDKLNMRDWPMWVFASLRGRWLYLPQPMSAYRIHSGGNWSSLHANARTNAEIQLFELFQSDLPASFKQLSLCKLAELYLCALHEACDSNRRNYPWRELFNVVRSFSHYHTSDSKRLVSAFVKFASPMAHSAVRRMLARTTDRVAWISRRTQ